MASRGSRFSGRVFGYRWADCGWAAAIFEFPQCAEVWISTDCEPRDQMIFAFAVPATEAEAIDEGFVVAHPAAKQAMVDLADRVGNVGVSKAVREGFERKRPSS